MHLRCFLVLGIFCTFTGNIAVAFVENVTHGYPACIACHTSPNGGGLLTEYGRSLSKELMSTWGVGDAFAQPFFGAIKNRETVTVGGDLRTIQTNKENNQQKQGELFVMQQNVELGVKIDNVTLVGTFGTTQGPSRTPNRGQFLSERHYLLWSPSPTSRLRVGKFRQSFGINTPNHNRLMRSRLGFGFFSETYNMEFTQFYETYEITISTSLGRFDLPHKTRSEKNISGHFTYYLNENSRWGGSYLLGESDSQRRNLFSLNSVFPISEHWLGLLELDYENKTLNSSQRSTVASFASFAKVAHKAFKGASWYLMFEHFSEERAGGYSLIQAPGIGIQWLPIPHINLQVEYTHRTSSSQPGNPDHLGWILLHTYL